MPNTGNPIELLVKISADTTGSRVGINKQLETLATQLEKLKVPIQIDPAAIKALTNLSKLDFSKLSSSMKAVEKDAKAMATVSAKEVEQAMKKASETIGMSFKGVLKGGTNDIETLKKQLQGLDAKVKVKYDMVDGKRQLESMSATIQKAGVASTTTFSKVMRDLGNGSKDIVWIPKTIQEIDSKLHNVVKTSDQFIARINKLQSESKITNQQFEKLSSSIAKMGSGGDLTKLTQQTDSMVASNKRIVAEQEKQKKQLKEQAEIQEKIRKLTNDITSAQGRNPKAFGNNTETKNMLATLQQINPAAKGAANAVKGVSDGFQQMKASAQTAGRESMSIMDSFRTAMEKFPIWMAASTAFYGVVRGIRSAVDQIISIDSQMTILKRVSGGQMEVNDVLSESIRLAGELGNAIADVNEGFIAFARQGFRGTDLTMMAEYATLLGNISDMSVEESSSVLTAAVKGFNIEAENSIHVVNALNEVDNNYAITTQQLATALMRSAGAASTYSVSLEKSIGYTAAIGEVTRESGSIIGNSLKSIYSRITSIPKAVSAMAEIGIGIKDSVGDMRPVEDILDDLGAKWGDLTAEQQQNLGLQVAGRYQLSRFLILMKQYDTALAATEAATNSAGSGYRENAEYLKSYQAQINMVKNAWTEAVISMRDNGLGDGMVAALGAGLGLFKVLGNVIDKVGVLPAVLGGATLAFALLSTTMKATVMTNGATFLTFIKSMPMFMNRMNASILAATVSMNIKTAATRVLTASYGALRAAAVSTMTFLAGTLLPIAGFMALGAAIAFVVSKITDHKKAQKELRDEIESTINKGIESVSTNKDKVNELIKSYENLSEKKKNGEWNTENEKEYLSVQQELGELFPSLIASVDAKGQSHLKSSEEIQKEIGAMEQLLALKQLEVVEKSKDTYKERIESIRDFQDELEAAQTKLKSFKTMQETALNEKTKENASKGIAEAEVEIRTLQIMIANAGDILATEVSGVSKAFLSSFTSVTPLIEEEMKKINDSIDFSNLKPDAIDAVRKSLDAFTVDRDKAFQSGNIKEFNSITKDMVDYLVNDLGQGKEEISGLMTSFNDLKTSINNKAEAQKEGSKIDDTALDVMEGLEGKAYELKDAIDSISGVTQAHIDETGNLAWQYDILSAQLETLTEGTSSYKEVSDQLSGTTDDLLNLYPQLSSEGLELIDVYERMSEGSYAAVSSSTELAEAKKRLLQLYPELESAGVNRVNMIQSIIGNIKQEVEANDILRAAYKASRDGKLTSDEDRALSGLQTAKNEIQNINEQIKALNKLAAAYRQFAQNSVGYAETLAKDAKATGNSEIEDLANDAMIRAQKWQGYASQAESSIDTYDAKLAGVTTTQKGFIDTLKNSEAVMGNTTTSANKLASEKKKAAKETSKTDKAQKDYNETLKESIYLANTYKEALEKLNLEQSRLNEIKSKYPTHSKEYKDAMEKELALMYEKKALIQDEAKYINSQISSGNVAKTGVVTKGSGGTYTGKYASEVNAAAAKHGIDAQIIAAVIKAESNFNPNAKSGSGARGLMQLMPATARGLGVKDSYDPAQNIMGGAKYLAQQLKTFGGDIKLALAAYNAGPNAVKKAGGIPKNTETTNYVKKITDALAKTAVSTAKSAGQSVANYYAGDGFNVTSGFGKRTAPKSGASTDHQGVDLAAKAGTAIKSLRAGKVIASYYHTTGGNMVSIQQDDGTVAKYMHMQNASNVKKGQSVKAGQEIGKVGSTGNSTGNHLHLEIVKDNKAVDPLPYLKEQNQSISDASQAIAENLQDLDSLRSDLNAKSQDIFSINEEIRNLQRSLIDVELDKYAKKQKVFLGFLDEEIAKKDSLDLTSTRYQNSLKRSIKYISKQSEEYQKELTFLESMIKNGKLDAKVKEEMQEKAEALRLTLVGLNNEMKNFSVERINASQQAFAENISDITYEIEKSKAIMGLYEEGSIEYNKEFTSQIEGMKSHQQQIKEQRDSLQRSLLLHDLNPETVKEYKDQIKQLGLEYWNLESSINSSNKELVESEKKMKTDLADKLIASYKSYIEETKTMKLRALDEEMKVEDKRHKQVTDNLKKEMDVYRDLIQTKLDSIDKEETETDYNKEMDKLGMDKSKIQGELNLLSMDDSYEAKAQRKKLQEELDALEETILDKRHKREVDLRKENLQEMLTAKEEAIAKEEEAEQLIHDNAKDRIDDLKTYWDQFYTDQLNDERRFAQLREDVMKGNFENISAEFKAYLTEMEETMPSLENTMDGTMQAVGTSVRQNIIDALKEAVDLMGQVSGGGGVSSAPPSHQGSAGAPPSGGSSSSSGGTSSGSGKTLSQGDLSVLGGKFLADKLRSQETNSSRRETISDRAKSMAADGRSQGSTLAANKGFDELVQGLSASEKTSLASYLGGRVQSMFSTPNLQEFISNYVKKLQVSGAAFETGGYTGKKSGIALLHDEEFVLNKGQTKEAFKMADLFANLNRFASMITTPKQPTLAGATTGDSYEFNFAVDKLNANEKEVNSFSKQIQDRLKRNKGVR